MTVRSLTISLVVSLIVLLASETAFAFCNPNTSNDPSERVVCSTHTDKTCPRLGVSTMDGDRQSILVCLATSATASDCAAGQCNWKVMTSSSSTSSGWIDVEALGTPKIFMPPACIYPYGELAFVSVSPQTACVAAGYKEALGPCKSSSGIFGTISWAGNRWVCSTGVPNCGNGSLPYSGVSPKEILCSK